MTHSCLRRLVRASALLLPLWLYLGACGREFSTGDRSTNEGGAAGASDGGQAGEGGDSGGSGGDGDGGTSQTARGGRSAKGGATGHGGVSAMGGSGGTSATTSTASTTPVTTPGCGFEANPTDDRTKRRILIRDEGASKFGVIDVGNAANSWFVTLDREDGDDTLEPQGRDLQLVGNCRVLVGTHVGYDEYDLTTHARVAAVTAYPGTLAAYRLASGNTMLVGVGPVAATPWLSQTGIVLIQVDATGATVGAPIVHAAGTYARLVRPTAQGTYLVGNNQQVAEIDAAGTLVAPSFVVPKDFYPLSAHAWMGVRVATAAGSNETLVMSGYEARLLIYNADGTIRKTITGGQPLIDGASTSVNANFFAGLQVLPNGNYLVTNWSNHGSGNLLLNVPIIEYNSAGAAVWAWRDSTYADRLSALQAAIVIDGLDLTKLNVEGPDGKLTAVK